MRNDWPEVSLGALATRRKDFTPVSADTLYRVVGVQRSGWGLVDRAPIRGDSMKFDKLMQLKEHDLVYRTITAFEAPSAVVDDSFEGAYVTPQTFPVYALDTTQILPGFMAILTTSPSFHEAMAVRCVGTVLRRKTLSQKAFESIPILLPSRSEQRRIVDLIGAVDTAIDAADDEVAGATAFGRAVRAREFFELSGLPTRQAGEMFDMLLGRQKSARQSVGDHVILYVRAGNISSGTVAGELQQMNFEPAEQEKYGLRRGDVLLAEGGTVGASARWVDSSGAAVGFDKHVIRVRGIDGQSSADFAHQWIRWANEDGLLDRTATGITIRALGFGRASALPVPDADIATQDGIVRTLTKFDDLTEAARDTARSLRVLRSDLLTVLLSGAHEVPVSYDGLLEEELA